MSSKVFTYLNPKNWDEHEKFDYIKNGIHICATANLKKGISERYKINGSFKHIFTINKFSKYIFPEWYSSESQLGQYIDINRNINNKINSNEHKSIYRTFKWNATLILESIRMLTESGVSPIDLEKSLCSQDQGTLTEKVFLDLWKNLESQGNFVNHRSRIKNGYENVEKIISKINGMIRLENERKKDLSQDFIHLKNNRIILHGFYYITPMQNVLLRFLERCGFEIVFFTLFNPDFPSTFNFIKSFVSSRYGWEDEWEYDIGKSKLGVQEDTGVTFLSNFEGYKTPVDSFKGELKGYESFNQFLEDVILENYPMDLEIGKNIEKNVRIIAPNADILNNILMQYYPNKYIGKRNFLRYPIGNFIINLHNIVQLKGLILTQNNLIKLFSSGWLHDSSTSKNSRNYLYQLEKILPFFEGCEKLEEWFIRLDDLKKLHKEFSIGRTQNILHDRFLDSTSNPLDKISYFDISLEEMEQINCFFLIIKQLVKALFIGDKPVVKVNIHFSRLLNLLNEINITASSDKLITTEEREIISEIKDRLSKVNNSKEVYLYDFQKALDLYLSGKLETMDEPDEDEIIIPFIQIDGEVFKENSEKVFITGLDERGLPFEKFKNPWPLTEVTVNKLGDYSRDFELFLLRNNSIKHVSRYLMYNSLAFLNAEYLEYSWMKSFADKEDLNPSLYLNLLNSSKDEIRMSQSTELDDLETNEYVELKLYNYDINDNELKDSLSELNNPEFKGIYLSYKPDFYYNYLLKKYKVHKDSISIQFTISAIAYAMKQQTGAPNIDIINQISRLVPQWTPYKSEAVLSKTLSYAKYNRNLYYTSHKNVKVNEQWKRISFPGIKQKDLKDLEKKIEEFNFDDKTLMEMDALELELYEENSGKENKTLIRGNV